MVTHIFSKPSWSNPQGRACGEGSGVESGTPVLIQSTGLASGGCFLSEF